MATIYDLKEELNKGAVFVVHNAVNSRTQQSCVIKQLVEEYPRPEHVAAIKYEYDILKDLQIENVIKVIELVTINGNPALVEESVDGQSVKYWMQKHPLELKDVLHLMVEVTKALVGLHAGNIIHKDINPSNIVWNPKTNVVRLIDFNTSSRLQEENLEVTGVGEMEGTLAYISPEQTGRINRELNYRTDFYSLGVTFFELATGKLPFQTNDPMEMLHLHIAKEPPHAKEINKQLPDAVSEIIFKCMQKGAENRYQSAFGLLQDLKRCLSSLEKNEQIEPFKIATKDALGQLNFTGVLFDRKQEIALLIQAFNEVKEGPSKLLTLGGYSGVGKTALVFEMRNYLAESKGYFIHGKADQYKKNIPYFPLIEAIQQLTQKVLVSGKQEIETWKTRILKAVGNSGRVITEMVPILEKLIGPQVEMAQLDPAESQARTEHILLEFLKSLSSVEKPLVIFIDDLQWADSSLLKLLKQLFQNVEDFSGLLLIGAFRDNEVDETHPLMQTLRKIKENGLTINKIDLLPLEEQYIHQWIAAILHENIEEIIPLSSIIYKKTLGNAFFTIQLLKELKVRDALFFNFEKGHWGWSVDKIKQMAISDNVVDLMIEKIGRLSPKGLKLIQLASCIGNRFDLRLLAIANKTSLQQTLLDLQEILQAGFIVPIDDSYKYLIEESSNPIMMHFQHDRIQQASHSLLDMVLRKQIHYEIGQLLLHKLAPQQLEEELLGVVEHLNYGYELINNTTEQLQLIELNLRAGKKANLSNAYEFAQRVLDFAISLLPSNCWDEFSVLTTDLYLEASRTALLSTESKRTHRLTQTIIDHTRDQLSMMRAFKIKIMQCAVEANIQEAIHLVVEAFKLAGLSITDRPSAEELREANAKIIHLIKEKTIASLERLPVMNNPLIENLIDLVAFIYPLLYYTRSDMMSLLSVEAIKLSMEHGNAASSAVAYNSFAVIISGNEITMACELCEMALKIQERHQFYVGRAITIHTTCHFILYWKTPYRDLIERLQEGYQIGLEQGELESASFCLFNIGDKGFLAGMNLDELYETVRQNIKRIKSFNCKFSIQSAELLFWVIALLSKNEEPSIALYDNKAAILRINVYKVFYYYLFQDLETAMNHSDQAEKIIYSFSSPPSLIIHKIFRTLTMIGLYLPLDVQKKQTYMAEINANLELFNIWKNENRANCQHLIALCFAEKMRIMGEEEQAEKGYQESIHLARKGAYLQDEAIALESLGRYYHAKGDEQNAKTTLIKSHDAYLRWGAKFKTAQMEDKYRSFFAEEAQPSSFTLSDTQSSRSTQGMSQRLDLASVMKAATLISGEIYLDKLIPKMLNVMIENAGAQRAVFIQKVKNQWEVLAKTSLEEGHEHFNIIAQSLEQSENLPKTVIDYVQRVKEAVVLADAEHDEQFGKDPYIRKIGAKSLLCMPIEHKDQLVAIMLFENNLNTHIFTQDRIQILTLLGIQAAISLENAHHFEHIERLYKSTESFIPKQFLKLLGKEHMEDVRLGDSIETTLTALFTDVRDYTTLTERLTPQESYALLNRYLKVEAPIIRANKGFICSYQGDGILALFPESAEDAINAVQQMGEALFTFNVEQARANGPILRVGYGLNTGPAMLGTIGEEERMEVNVISDAINAASRVEALNKFYGTEFLISDATMSALTDSKKYLMRRVDNVHVKGKKKPMHLYEVYPKSTISIEEKQFIEAYEKAFKEYEKGNLGEAIMGFKLCQIIKPIDKSSVILQERCEELFKVGLPEDWNGTFTLLHK